MGNAAQLLLLPTAAGASAQGPTPGAFGNALIDIEEYGGAYPELNLGTNPRSFLAPRVPKILATYAGTVLEFIQSEQSGSPPGTPIPDNTAGFITVRRSTDKGITWSKASPVAIIASRGAGNNAVAVHTVAQCPHAQDANNTIILLYALTKNANTTSGSWKDLNGNLPAQNIAQIIYALKSQDDGVTWTDLSGSASSVGTDITSQFTVTDNANQVTCSAVSNLGTVKYRCTVTAAGGTAFVGTQYYIVRFSSLAGTDAAAMNYATNGNKSVLCKCINATTLDPITFRDGSALPTNGLSASQTAPVLPETAWMVPAGDSCANTGGTHPGRMNFPFNCRTSCSPTGPVYSVSMYTDNASASPPTFSCSTQDTSQIAIDEFEGSIVYEGGDNLYYICRAGSGQYRTAKLSTDGGTSWGIPQQETGLACCATAMAGATRSSGLTIVISPSDASASGGDRFGLGAYWTSGGALPRTWHGPLIFNGLLSAYSSATTARDGTIYVVAERDYADSSFGGFPGRVGLWKMNAPAVQKGTTVIEETKHQLNDLPNGTTAWTNMVGAFDIGNLAAHAKILGAPVYTTTGSVVGLKFGPGGTTDGLSLGKGKLYSAGGNSWDTGDFLFECGFQIPVSTGVGVIRGGNPSGSKGWCAKITAGGTVTVIFDDGAGHTATATNGAGFDDGAGHKLSIKYTASSKQLSINVDGSNTNTDMSACTGGIVEADTVERRIGQFNDGSGNWTAAHPIILWNLHWGKSKTLTTIDINSQAAAPTYSPASKSGGPLDTSVVPSAMLKLLCLRTDSGFANRSRSLAGPAPSSPPDGWPVQMILDESSGAFATANLNATVGQYQSRTVVPGVWVFDNTADVWTFDTTNNPVGRYAALTKLQSNLNPWTIFGVINIPSAFQASNQYILNNIDGSGNGFRLSCGMAATNRLGFEAKAGGVQFKVDWEPALYTADTDYYFALDFSGTSGTGAAGLTGRLITLASVLTLADVTATNAKITNMASQTQLSGNTNGTGTTDSTAGLSFSSAATPFAGKGSSFGICIGKALSDADHLNMAKYFAVAASGGSSAPTASFTLDNVGVATNGTITLTDTSPGGPTAGNIDWGDGSVPTHTLGGSHQYTVPGLFLITYTVANGQGQSSATKYVVVGAQVAAFTSLNGVGYVFKDTARTQAATATNDVVAGWTDISSNSRHLTQSTVANQPKLKANAINTSLPSVDFSADAARTLVTGSFAGPAQDLTVFMVVKQHTWTGNNVLAYGATNSIPYVLQRTTSPDIGLYGGGAFIDGDGSVALGNWSVLTHYTNSTSSYVQQNGHRTTPGTAVGTTGMGTSTFQLGFTSGSADQEVFAVLLFGTTTQAQRDQITAALDAIAGNIY